MWAGANVDKAVRPRGELLLLINQQKHEIQRQQRKLERKQQEIDQQQQDLDASKKEIDHLVAELNELKKRKREDQGSNNIASSQWTWREPWVLALAALARTRFKSNWNKRKWILPS